MNWFLAHEAESAELGSAFGPLAVPQTELVLAGVVSCGHLRCPCLCQGWWLLCNQALRCQMLLQLNPSLSCLLSPGLLEEARVPS